MKTPEQWADDLSVFVTIDPVDYMVLPHDCFYKLGGRTSIASVFQTKLGIPILPGRTLEKDARKNRLAITHQYLSIAVDKKPYLLAHSNCKNLIRTLPELVYSKTNIEDVDTDSEDHAYDALSLGLMSIMQGAMKSGAVRPPQPVGRVQKHWQQDQAGNIQSPDFWAKFKEEIKNKKNTSWEYR